MSVAEIIPLLAVPQSKYSMTLPLAGHFSHITRADWRRVICWCAWLAGVRLLLLLLLLCICGLTLIFHVKPCETTLCSIFNVYTYHIIYYSTDRQKRKMPKAIICRAHTTDSEAKDREQITFIADMLCACKRTVTTSTGILR